jgi:D-alanyl-D-alanine carboxypeptidase
VGALGQKLNPSTEESSEFWKGKIRNLNDISPQNKVRYLEVSLDDLMSGYFVGYEPDIKQNDYIIPGGSMIATAQDVGVFLRALIDGSLLNESEQEIYSSIYTYEHTGELPGYLSIARYHKDIDAVVILFINTSGGSSWSKTESVYRRIIRILERKN